MKEKILPIVFGKTAMSERMALRGGRKEALVPIDFIFYYIKKGSRRILVDAGCDSLPGFVIHDRISPKKALEEKGIDPEAITDLILTHAHHDHIEGAKYFPNATVYLQKEEYEEGKEYLPDSARVVLFEEGYSLCEGIRIFKIGGHSVGSSVVEVLLCGRKFLLCGDECYISRSIKEKIPTGESFCREKSMEFVEMAANSDSEILLSHEFPKSAYFLENK